MEIERLRELVRPSRKLEQYSTPAAIVSDMLWEEIVSGRAFTRELVVDLGAGTGRICIGAAKFLGRECIGIEIDRVQARAFLENASAFDVAERVHIVVADVRMLPLRGGLKASVMMNPPFGTSRRGMDRVFLERALDLGPSRVYSVHMHNLKSLELFRRLAEAWGYTLIKHKQHQMLLKQTMEHHRARTRRIPVMLLVFERRGGEQKNVQARKDERCDTGRHSSDYRGVSSGRERIR